MMRRKRRKSTDEDTAQPEGADGATPSEDQTPEGAEVAAEAEASAEDSGPLLEEQLSEAQERFLRMAAELENARRRARLDVDEARRYGVAPLLTDLLEVLDALQRALANSPGGADDPLHEGLVLTEQQFVSVLTRHGVTPVDSRPGQPTDPSFHRVLVEQPHDEHPPGSIVTEITRGYRLHDRLLREAQVVVAARPAPTAEATAVDEPAATDEGDSDAPGEERDDADV